MTSIAVLAGEILSNLLYLVLLLLPALYWCVDPALGLRVMLLTMVSGGLNIGLKILFQVPRLSWGSSLAGGGPGEQSYAFPSTHAEQTATAVGWLACTTRTLPAFAVAVVLIVIVGVARVLAGAHTPVQVVGGTLVGLALVAVMLVLDHPLAGWLGNLTMGGQILAAVGGSVLLLVLYPACLAAGGLWPVPGSLLSSLAGPLDPSAHLIWTGLFFGIATGAVLTAHHQGFPPAPTMRRMVIRYTWGITGVLLIGLTFQALAGHAIPPLSWMLVSLGAVVCGWWITAVVPAICRHGGR
ncbi:phosphatase PAP2 family protein [Methanosphaerula palustris]|uniref:Phosphoesterase PA-phosphatase related n=1 Tax=Methanosphaerula palustris (strain ATCC BAA-1556 / DSM 19958 / E1-9c) TaxID=521011 RepID=B8GE51_METPE|nr:phosphatase PAP2 family protein [Methanosphaerula palustris]ACL17552.1 phosphoesterase PA-phosphatase related [Methanosphaerula palustris E1-9c]